MKRELPFVISRVAGQTLVDQVASGIRQAIATGRYKPGEVLPTRHEFAVSLGVSERVPREAVAKLAAEGLVYTRRCLGCVVSEKGERRWLGRVLFVESDDFSSYYYAALFSSFRREMSAAGYLVSSVSCPIGRSGVADVSPLEEALEQLFDFVVMPFFDASIVRAVEASGVRYLVASRHAVDGSLCVERFEVETETAIGKFIDHCRRAGVRKIMQVGMRGLEEFLSLRERAQGAGIRLVSWNIGRSTVRSGLENITYGTMNAFREQLKSGRDWLPDLFFFWDDFVASGALMALLDAGVRVPEDVKVVTLSNRGNCPVFPKSLARIEIDPFQNGMVLSEHVLRHLAPSRRKACRTVGYRYIRGQTFAM